MVERYVRGTGGRVDRIVYEVKGVEIGRTVFTYSDGPEPAEVAFFSAAGERMIAPVGPCLGAHRIVFTYADGKPQERVDRGNWTRRSMVIVYDARKAAADRSALVTVTRRTLIYH